MESLAFSQEFAERCTEPGRYVVSEELRRKDQVPKAEDGTEMGTAEGVWAKGEVHHLRDAEKHGEQSN